MSVYVKLVPGYARLIEIESTKTVHKIVRTTERIARRNLSEHVRTGELINSLHSRFHLGRGTVWIGTNHWQHVEYGTRPHIILPRYKKALWWIGARHPVARVRHPGTRAYAPMRRAAAEVRTLYGGY